MNTEFKDRYFSKKGTIEKQIEAANVYSRVGFEAEAFTHICGYGANVMALFGNQGMIFKVYGNSGSGKSTVLRSTNSVFGEPLPLYPDDTHKFWDYKLKNLNGNCVICEDMHEARNKQKFYKSTISGYKNIRAYLVVASCYGEPDKLEDNVFSYHVGNTLLSKKEISTINQVLDNYGHTGELFYDYILKNPKVIVKLIKLHIKHIKNNCKNNYTWRAQEAIAFVLVAGIISRNMGLHSFDMDRIKDWVYKELIGE